MKSRARYRTLGDLYGRAAREDGCLLWQGIVDQHGYGLVNGRRHNEFAHRRAWELGHGIAIPDDFDVHHACRRRSCIRLEHLELIPHRIHAVLHSGAGATCSRGHFDWQIRADNGRRICRECRRVHSRIQYWANPEDERARVRKRYWAGRSIEHD